ncbi:MULTISPECIES: FecR family protein [unclassified Butyricimonas]|uniref:FecR family protein n=1 Tax=unclassified Butyricimonas TaxID=2637652 RepID=UPI0013A60F94|nr:MULTISPECIES: FecR family protein [unclassified Butyricimonas]
MNVQSQYRISKLIAAYWSGTISREEEEELLTWRTESVKNEELFQRILRGKRFLAYQEQSAEHDFRGKFARLEERIKRDHRRVIFKRMRYAAVFLPFIFACVWFLLERDVFMRQEHVVGEQIVAGSSRAILAWGEGKTVYLEHDVVRGELDSTVIANRDTLNYLRDTSRGQDKPDIHTLTIPRGGEFFVNLADGTKVWLNADSELKYPTRFTGTERVVYLKGEAYFQVTYNAKQPFIVMSEGQTIRVLGTSFAVRNYENEERVLTTLEEGRVRVSAGEQNVELRPGNQAVLTDGRLDVKEVNTSEYTAWHKGKYVFVDKPLGEIMSTLSRWYDMTVFYTSADLENIQFTGELVRYADIRELLNKFEVLEKVKFDIKNKTLIVNRY